MINLNKIETSFCNKLIKYFNEFGSDKETSHQYSHGYDFILTKTNNLYPNKLLEIGICNERSPEKSSLHSWGKIFPNSTIFGMDLEEQKMVNYNNIKSFVADQSDTDQLQSYINHFDSPEFNIIIDDASHKFNDARTSFEFLFNYLSLSGVYIIEDISKINNGWQQTVDDWKLFLSSQSSIHYDIIDCRPESPNDDSVLIYITKDN